MRAQKTVKESIKATHKPCCGHGVDGKVVCIIEYKQLKNTPPPDKTIYISELGGGVIFNGTSAWCTYASLIKQPHINQPVQIPSLI